MEECCKSAAESLEDATSSIWYTIGSIRETLDGHAGLKASDEKEVPVNTVEDRFEKSLQSLYVAGRVLAEISERLRVFSAKI